MIDGVGFRFSYADGGSDGARWDDPSLRFSLYDLTEALARDREIELPVGAKKHPHPYLFVWGWEGWKPGGQWIRGPERTYFPVYLTAEAYRALDAAAQAAKVPRYEDLTAPKVARYTRIYRFGPGKATPPRNQMPDK